MFFRCRNCGGNTVYSPEHKGMFCPYCSSVESQERAEEGIDTTICANCGGEIPIQEHSNAVFCPYCGTSHILDGRVTGQYTPAWIIPFQHGKEAVKKLMRDKFAGMVFAPTDFLSEVRLKEMQGDYVPFWFYDYTTNNQYRGEGRSTRVWTMGDIEYTETSIYSIEREMAMSFHGIPADASIAKPDNIMDLMEPYDYNGLRPFAPEYMSGFHGEKYNMPAEELESRAHRKMEKAAKELVGNTIKGYGAVAEQSYVCSVTDQDAKYGLLPIWSYHYQYAGKPYPFTINGQTAKIVGRVPVSGKKVVAYSITLWACMTGILGLLYLISQLL